MTTGRKSALSLRRGRLRLERALLRLVVARRGQHFPRGRVIVARLEVVGVHIQVESNPSDALASGLREIGVPVDAVH